MKENSSITTIHWLTLLLLAFIWGSSFILMKIGLKSFSSYHVAGMRVVLSAVVLSPYGIKGLRKVTKSNYTSFLIAGVIGIALPSFLFTEAQTKISSSLAGMLNSLTPLATLAIGFFFYRTSLNRKLISGVLTGLAGALLILASSGNSSTLNLEWKALLIVLATSCYGIQANEVKTRLKHFTGIEITSVSLLFAGPPILIYLVLSDYSYVNIGPDFWLSLSAIAGLSLAGTAFALILFNSLIKHTTAVFATSVTYIIPAFAILWGLLAKEKISFLSIIGIAFVLFGVFLVSFKKPKKSI